MAAPLEFKLPSFDKEHLKGIESTVSALQQTLQSEDIIDEDSRPGDEVYTRAR